MSQDEVLQKMRAFVDGKVAYQVAHTEVAWRDEVHDLLPLYLLFRILDRLESIDETLISMDKDSWERHHNR